VKKAFHLWHSLRWWSVGLWRCSVREEYQSMRSAQCASAPSHPFHVMPSRITRNSYRPRASYRTMVASEATSALAALSQLDSMSPSAEKLTRMDNKPNFSREVKLQWAGSRETTSTSGRGGTFFLTSLFIELIDPHTMFAALLVPDSQTHRPRMRQQQEHQKRSNERHIFREIDHVDLLHLRIV